MAVPVKQSFAPLSNLWRRVGDWWRCRATLNQLAQCDERDLQRLLHDLNVTRSELNDAVIRGAYPKIMLPEMLRALGLPSDRLKARYFNRVCEQCSSPTRCRKELDAGTASANYREFCHNAPTLDALLAEAAREAGKQDTDTPRG